MGNNTIELASTKYVFACFEVTISPLYIYTHIYMVISNLMVIQMIQWEPGY